MQTEQTSTSLPQGPRFFPPHRFIIDPDSYMRQCSERYGDPFVLTSVFGKDVVCCSPETVKTLFTTDPEAFDVAFKEHSIPLMGEHSLIFQIGAKHKQERKLLAPPFHGDRMRAYGDLMKQITLRHMARFPIGKPFPILDTTQAISLDVILQAVFGITEAARVDPVRKAILNYINALNPLFIFFSSFRRDFLGFGPWSHFKRTKAALFSLLQEEITLRRSQGQREDILSLLLAAKYDDGTSLSTEEIRDQLVTLLFAGHETTAISLSWALYYLHKDPEALSAVKKELATFGTDPSPEALAGSALLGSVCHETLRLRPLLPVLPIRKLMRPVQLAGHLLPAGVGLTACPAVLHHNPALYPDPERFVYGRFLDKAPSPFAFLSFGGGPRRCLGAAFAIHEMKVVLGTLLARSQLHLHKPDKKVREIRRNLTMGPIGGIPMVVTERG